MFNLLKFFIYYIYSKIIILSLIIAKIKGNKPVYTSSFGFGDNVVFNIFAKNKITKNKIFCFSKTQYEVANFFYNKKYIYRSIILLPKALSESHIGYNFLVKSKFFKSLFLKRKACDGKLIPISFYFQGNYQIKKFIINRLKQKKISENLKKILKKKTMTLFVKNFSLKKKNHINFQVRQTRNLEKIYALINYILKKKINLIILGNNKDHFIKILENNKKITKKKNLYLFKNISKDYSIQDQAYLALKSIGWVGSGSGANAFFGLLNKKLLYIDWIIQLSDKYMKNIKYIYKKIYNKKLKITYKMNWYDKYDAKNEIIIENNFQEIKKNLKKYFKL